MAEQQIDLMQVPLIGFDDGSGSGHYIIDAEQFITQQGGSYTLTSQTAAQKLFNASTNGTLTVLGSTAYFFECQFALTSLSSSNSKFGFAIGGTATLTSIAWTSLAATLSSLTASATSPNITFNSTASNTGLMPNGTSTNGIAMIKGIIRINAAGTIIPQVSLATAAAAIVSQDSYFRIWPCGGPLDGSQNVGFQGPWT